jgi:hypothetical protein
MNRSMLRRNIGKRFHLVPPAFAQRVDGEPEERNDAWRLEAVDPMISLVNERTGHRVELASDHVGGYTSSLQGSDVDCVLEVKLWIDITSAKPVLTMYPTGPARNAPRFPSSPLRVRLRQLLDRISPDILRSASASHKRVAVMVGTANLNRLNQLRDESGFDSLIEVRSTGSVIMGSGCRIGGHIHEENALGSLHGVELTIKRDLL